MSSGCHGDLYSLGNSDLVNVVMISQTLLKQPDTVSVRQRLVIKTNAAFEAFYQSVQKAHDFLRGTFSAFQKYIVCVHVKGQTQFKTEP